MTPKIQAPELSLLVWDELCSSPHLCEEDTELPVSLSCTFGLPWLHFQKVLQPLFGFPEFPSVP